MIVYSRSVQWSPGDGTFNGVAGQLPCLSSFLPSPEIAILEMGGQCTGTESVQLMAKFACQMSGCLTVVFSFHSAAILIVFLGLLGLIDILLEVILTQFNAQFQSLSARIGARFPPIPQMPAAGERVHRVSDEGWAGGVSTDMICVN